MATSIEWTDATWNPVTGCSKVSPGCAHCYAETVALRFWPSQYPPMQLAIGDPEATNTSTWERDRRFTDVQCHDDRLDQPLRWRKPRKVFVNSMSDLFHENVPDAFIDRVFAVMALAPQHIFQVLTKRAERMRSYMNARGPNWLSPNMDFGSQVNRALKNRIGLVLDWYTSQQTWPPINVWLGVSVENQHFADERIPLLFKTPAAVRFLSCEPLLEGLDLAKHRPGANRLDWCIVGGESGPGARPCETWWIRNIVGQCRYAGVPVFVKQLGAKPIEIVDDVQRWDLNLKNRKGGDPAEWPEDLRLREFPAVAQ